MPLAVVALGLVLLASRARAADTDAQSTPSPDDPPALTHSDKVRPSRDAARAPALGPSPAKVNVIVFSDFQCPVCRRTVHALHQIPEEWPGDVRVEFRPIALPLHRNAENAAVASLVAHRQGKFWEMHDVLFANQGTLDPDGLTAHAREAGLDMKRYAKDYADPALRRRVQEESKLAATLGATGTPSFLVNGKLAVGWASWGAFRWQVEQELNAVNALLNQGTRLPATHALRAQANAKDEAAFAAYKAAIIDAPAKTDGAAKH
jgi:protein-disulfide isomerase